MSETMLESKIARVELYAVADRNAETLPWADDQEPLLYQLLPLNIRL